VKHGLKDLLNPHRLRKSLGFGFGDKPKFQDFRRIRVCTTAAKLRFKHRHYVGSPVTIAITDDELGTSKDADEPHQPDEHACFLEHFAYGSIRRAFGWFDRATG
jgi:hypothetical protein